MLAAPSMFNIFGILKATSKSHIRDAQNRFLIDPLLERLQRDLVADGQRIDGALQSLLPRLREHPAGRQGFGAANLLHLFRALRSDLDGFDFSQMVIRSAYLTDMNLRGVDFSECSFEICTFLDVFGAVLSVTFSQNGKLIAAGDSKNGIRIWAFETGKKLQTLEGHGAWVRALSFAPDARISDCGEKAIGTIASCGEEPTYNIRLWDLTTGQTIQTLPGHEHRARRIQFSPGGKRLISCGDDRTVKIWGKKSRDCGFSKNPLRRTEPLTSRVMSVAYSPDGRLVASGGDKENGVLLWRGEDLSFVKRLGGRNGHSNEVNAVAFSPDGRLLASGGADSSVRIWDLEVDEPLHVLDGHEDAITNVQFDPSDGSKLASGSIDHSVRLWDAGTGEGMARISAHDREVADLAFAPPPEENEDPQGTTTGKLVTAGRDNRVRLWNLSSGDCIRTWQGYDNAVIAVAFRSPDGKMLASGAQDASVRIWDLGGQRVRRTLTGHSDRVNHLAFHPSGEFLASGGDDRTVRLWDPDSGDCLETLSGHTGVVVTLTFSQNGQLLASSGHDGEVRFWSVARFRSAAKPALGTRATPLPLRHTAFVRPVAFHPISNDVLATASDDLDIHLWSLVDGKGVARSWSSGHKSWITTLAFSLDGALLYTAADDGVIREWDTGTKHCLREFSGHEQGVRRLALSPDGRTLASAANDRTARIWDLRSGECKVLEGHSQWVWSVAYSPDGTSIATGSEDEEIRLWSTTDWTCQARLRVPLPYADMMIGGATGLSDAERVTLRQLGALERKGVSEGT